MMTHKNGRHSVTPIVVDFNALQPITCWCNSAHLSPQV